LRIAPSITYEFPEDALSGRRAAYIAHADEEDFCLPIGIHIVL